MDYINFLFFVCFYCLDHLTQLSLYKRVLNFQRIRYYPRQVAYLKLSYLGTDNIINIRIRYDCTPIKINLRKIFVYNMIHEFFLSKLVTCANFTVIFTLIQNWCLVIPAEKISKLRILSTLVMGIWHTGHHFIFRSSYRISLIWEYLFETGILRFLGASIKKSIGSKSGIHIDLYLV